MIDEEEIEVEQMKYEAKEWEDGLRRLEGEWRAMEKEEKDRILDYIVEYFYSRLGEEAKK